MTVLAVNGRFRGQTMTGVQRYATEVVAALERQSNSVVVLEPPGSDPVRARAWELWSLGADARRVTGARATVNLTNWGPVRGIDDSTVVVHDTAPIEAPAGFSSTYRTLVRVWMRALRHSGAQVVTVSTRSRRSLERIVDRPVPIVPNGVDIPIAQERHALGRPWVREQGLERYALLVGGHDHRKNAAFAVALLPELRRRGLDLVVTHRTGSQSLKLADLAVARPGLRLVADPSDVELWGLYGQAEVVLHPSAFEGFGLPMLEGAAVGTPFLTTDVGAAEDLVVDPRQVLPLDLAAWSRALDVLLVERSAWSAAGRAQAARFTWESSAEALLQVVEEHRARRARTRSGEGGRRQGPRRSDRGR